MLSFMSNLNLILLCSKAAIKFQDNISEIQSTFSC